MWRHWKDCWTENGWQDPVRCLDGVSRSDIETNSWDKRRALLSSKMASGLFGMYSAINASFHWGKVIQVEPAERRRDQDGGTAHAGSQNDPKKLQREVKIFCFSAIQWSSNKFVEDRAFFIAYACKWRLFSQLMKVMWVCVGQVSALSLTCHQDMRSLRYQQRHLRVRSFAEMEQGVNTHSAAC